VEEIIVYGSKARGDAHQDSDVDILVRIKEGDRKLKKAISMEHFEATIGKYMLPMVMVCTDEDRQRWNIESTSFVRAVQRDGVAVR
jgi:predicted nucleotidyltransferase